MSMMEKNDGETGYDAPGGNAVGAYDHLVDNRRVGDISRTIVEFPGPNNAALRARRFDVGRYENETVSINLGTATKPSGAAVELPR